MKAVLGYIGDPALEKTYPHVATGQKPGSLPGAPPKPRPRESNYDLPQRLFTIGHSSLAVEVFLDLLLRFGITAVADVRSSPYSRYVPRYNRETVQQILPASNIEYPLFR